MSPDRNWKVGNYVIASTRLKELSEMFVNEVTKLPPTFNDEDALNILINLPIDEEERTFLAYKTGGYYEKQRGLLRLKQKEFKSIIDKFKELKDE